MGERIETPPTLQGDEKKQLQQVWSYLYQLAESINNNLQGIGSNELTDSERAVMQNIITEGEAQGLSETETLKSLIIKTADFVQSNLQEFRLNLLGETVASGQFGRYVRHTGLDVAVTPTGITQNYSFEEVVQGLKEYSINAKNYIKTGLLRTVSSIPVYGVAIGKDVVTFSQDGTETYNDGNKVAELTADELSFWQNGVKVAGYTGSRISFYYGGVEAFYILNGKLYAAGDMEITNGKKMIIASGADLEVKSGGDLNLKSGGKLTAESGADIEVASGGDINVKSGGNLSVASGGNIDINGTGNLKLTGSTVEIKSGSTFEVDASNFKINSTDRKLITGDWTFDDRGIKCEGTTKIEIGELRTPSPNACIYPYPESSSYTQLRFRLKSTEYRLGGNNSAFYPYSAAGSKIGTSDNKWDFGYFDTIYYDYLNQNSSKEIKHDIQDLPEMGERLDRLRPVTFVYDNDENEKQRMGLIYEDTLEAMPEICTGDESDKAISYMELVPALLKEIQGLRARVKALEEREGGN